jgi:hypothetical protein
MKIIAKQFPHTAISGFQPTGLVPYFDEYAQYWTEQFGRFQRQDSVFFDFGVFLDDTGLAGVLGVRLTGVYGGSIFSISSESGAGKTSALA